MNSNLRPVIIGLIISFILQILIAPSINIFSVIPNFVVAWVIVCAVVSHNSFGFILPFVAGLLLDLFSGNPVGTMAFSLTLSSAITVYLADNLDNDTAFMLIASIVFGIILVEFNFGMLMLVFNVDANLFSGFLYRILPCALLDAIIAFGMYFVATRVLASMGPAPSHVTNVR